MKKLNSMRFFILFALLVSIFISCEEETVSPTEVSFFASEFTTTESGGDMAFGFHLNAPAASDIVIGLSTSGTATAGTDYELVESSTTIKAGETNGSFKIKAIVDCIAEGDETIIVTMSASDVTASGTYTITIAGNSAFVQSAFTGEYDADEPGYGVYVVEFTADPTDGTVVINHNFWDFAGVVRYKFNPANNTLTIPTQDVVMGGVTYVVASGTGASTYDACGHGFITPYTVRQKSNGALLDSNTHTFVKL